MRTFLSASWQNLLLFNYSVDPAILLEHLPPGCEPDLRDGKAWASLVGFQFLETRVFGVSWPGFTTFPEVNLRFYVRMGAKRGVCFIREYVPSTLVSGIARLLYHEPYRAVPMKGEVTRENGMLRAFYSVTDGGRKLALSATADERPWLPAEDSPEHFFKEHDLGVGRDRHGRRITYQVEHPPWRVFPVRDFDLKMSAGLYGSAWDFLSTRKPDSALLAEGSAIRVMRRDE